MHANFLDKENYRKQSNNCFLRSTDPHMPGAGLSHVWASPDLILMKRFPCANHHRCAVDGDTELLNGEVKGDQLISATWEAVFCPRGYPAPRQGDCKVRT